MNKKNIESIYPLSPQQQGMLLESILASEVGARGTHIEQFTCVLHGDLDVDALDQVWQQVVSRHSALRTAFVWKEQDEPLQVVFRRVRVPVERQDWRGLTPAEQQTRLQTYLAADRQQDFKLATAPLIRVAIIRTSDDTHRLVWTFHHVLLDGWSQSLVLNDMFSTYLALKEGQSLTQEPSPPYRDYVAWLTRQDLSTAKSYWQETLYGFIWPTPLGAESSGDETSGQGAPYGYRSARLSATATKTLQDRARQRHLTLNTLVQGIWALLLGRYSGQDDVVFGTTVSGRPADLDNVESTVGLFITSLPLRVQVSPQAKLWSWLEELQTHQLDLQNYSYCTAGQIHQWSEMPGTLPLYESLLVFENYPADFSTFGSTDLALEIDGMQAVGAQTNHAITLLVVAGSDIGLQLVYQRQRIDDESVSEILEHFFKLLEHVATNDDPSLAEILDQIPTEQIPKVVPLLRPGSHDNSTVFVAPRTPTEETLTRIWADVLDVEQVGIHHSFFEMGGYSLLAIRAISHMRETFQVELPLRFLFESPTIAEQAVAIVQKRAEQVDAETLEQLLAELEQSPSEENTR